MANSDKPGMEDFTLMQYRDTFDMRSLRLPRAGNRFAYPLASIACW